MFRGIVHDAGEALEKDNNIRMRFKIVCDEIVWKVSSIQLSQCTEFVEWIRNSYFILNSNIYLFILRYWIICRFSRGYDSMLSRIC